jgi:hypothetical protein
VRRIIGRQILGVVPAKAEPNVQDDAGERSCSWYCDQRFHIVAVIPRESGESSTPRPLDSITASSEYWIARSSRAMTTEGVEAFSKLGFQPPDTPSRSRGMFRPSYASSLHPSSKKRAQGRPGAGWHPQSRVQENAHGWTTGEARTSRPSLRERF